jgi:hypothetical protein
VQVEGENFLVPVDFHAEREADVRCQAFPADQVLERIQEAGATLSIVVLDACHDNPFRSTRSGTKGLAAMTTGKGGFIAFATSPGATASDNAGETNGLFTKYLLASLGQPLARSAHTRHTVLLRCHGFRYVQMGLAADHQSVHQTKAPAGIYHGTPRRDVNGLRRNGLQRR